MRSDRTPPLRKVWEIVGSPRLLVIGSYQMGFDIEARGPASFLRVFIDYEIPTTPLGWLFGRYYARWCTKSMVAAAAQHFQSLGTA